MQSGHVLTICPRINPPSAKFPSLSPPIQSFSQNTIWRFSSSLFPVFFLPLIQGLNKPRGGYYISSELLSLSLVSLSTMAILLAASALFGGAWPPFSPPPPFPLTTHHSPLTTPHTHTSHPPQPTIPDALFFKICLTPRSCRSSPPGRFGAGPGLPK